MELCSKILTATDVGVRLSIPTSMMREHFRLEIGGRSLDFEVMDNKGGKLWTFHLYTRKNDGHPKPVLTRGWIEFVKRKGLKQGDKLIFLVQGQGNDEQLQIQIVRKIRLMGHEHWAEI